MTATNKALAQIFVSMADKLATQQANPHRVRAYRRAAESLVELEEDVSLVAERGSLQEIPGIGKDLSARIQEFLKTGKIRAYEEMKTPLPPEVAGWATLPGLSDNVIQHLYSRLGIKTLDDLESLVRSHLLRTLPGVTASDEELLAAIETRKQTD